MSERGVTELWRLAGLLLLSLVLGALFGHILLGIMAGLALYLGWNLYNLIRLERWFREGKTYSPPESSGLWGEVFHDLYRLQRRHKQRQKRLVNLLSRFRETTTAMPDGVVLMNIRGKLEWWNEAAAKLLDLVYPSDVGQRITNLVRNPEFTAFFKRGEPNEVLRFKCPADEQKIISVRITPYAEDQLLLVVRDVTLVQQVDRMRRDFVANISHELRTPLTVMSGFLEALSTEVTDPSVKTDEAQLQRSLQLMQQQTARMDRLVEDLMLLSKLEDEGKSKREDVVAVPQLLHTLEEEGGVISGERKHKISAEIDPELYIHGDSKELDSAFRNLVVNAINYTPAGGSIKLRWYRDDKGAHFEVSDTGIGIPPHHLPRITERFYRVDVGRSRETGGSGLGLAIVKHALQRHGAELRVDSEIGRGSTFACDFPPQMIVDRQSAMQAL